MTRHYDAEELARFNQGDLPWWRAWQVRSRLGRCASCREEAAELAWIPALLASVPEPALPDHVTARIQGALAQEAALRAGAGLATAEGGADPERAGAGGPATAVPSATGPSTTGPAAAERPARTGDRTQRRRNWLPQLTPAGSPVAVRVAAAAAAVAIFAVGGVEIAEHAGQPSPPSTSSGTPHSASQPSGAGPALYYTSDGLRRSIRAIATRTDFTHGHLSSQVSRLTGVRSPAAVPGTAPQAAAPVRSGTSPAFGNFSVTSLDGCVNRIAAGNLLVVLVDVARYQGAPATVIVTRPPAAGPLQVWVVGSGCSASRSDTLAHAQLASGS